MIVAILLLIGLWSTFILGMCAYVLDNEWKFNTVRIQVGRDIYVHHGNAVFKLRIQHFALDHYADGKLKAQINAEYDPRKVYINE